MPGFTSGEYRLSVIDSNDDSWLATDVALNSTGEGSFKGLDANHGYTVTVQEAAHGVSTLQVLDESVVPPRVIFMGAVAANRSDGSEFEGLGARVYAGGDVRHAVASLSSKALESAASE